MQMNKDRLFLDNGQDVRVGDTFYVEQYEDTFTYEGRINTDEVLLERTTKTPHTTPHTVTMKASAFVDDYPENIRRAAVH